MLVSIRQSQEHLTSLLQGSSSSTPPCHHTSDMSNKINLKPLCNVLGAAQSAKSPYNCGRKTASHLWPLHPWYRCSSWDVQGGGEKNNHKIQPHSFHLNIWLLVTSRAHVSASTTKNKTVNQTKLFVLFNQCNVTLYMDPPGMFLQGQTNQSRRLICDTWNWQTSAVNI